MGDHAEDDGEYVRVKNVRLLLRKSKLVSLDPCQFKCFAFSLAAYNMMWRQMVIMLDKATVKEIVKQYADVVIKELSPVDIILYGSYAKGNANSESDIDVAVICDGFSGDWLATSGN